MSSINKTKFFFGLIISALFVIGLFSLTGKNTTLLAPTPTLAAAPGGNSPTHPDIVHTPPPFLALKSAEDDLYYKFFIYDYTDINNPIFKGESPFIRGTNLDIKLIDSEPKPGWTVTDVDLTDGILYAWTAKDCNNNEGKEDDSGNICSGESQPYYFRIELPPSAEGLCDDIDYTEASCPSEESLPPAEEAPTEENCANFDDIDEASCAPTESVTPSQEELTTVGRMIRYAEYAIEEGASKIVSWIHSIFSKSKKLEIDVVNQQSSANALVSTTPSSNINPNNGGCPCSGGSCSNASNCETTYPPGTHVRVDINSSSVVGYSWIFKNYVPGPSLGTNYVSVQKLSGCSVNPNAQDTYCEFIMPPQDVELHIEASSPPLTTITTCQQDLANGNISTITTSGSYTGTYPTGIANISATLTATQAAFSAVGTKYKMYFYQPPPFNPNNPQTNFLAGPQSPPLTTAGSSTLSYNGPLNSSNLVYSLVVRKSYGGQYIPEQTLPDDCVVTKDLITRPSGGESACYACQAPGATSITY